MHIHRYEKIWLIFGIAMLAVFLTVVGVSAFARGMEPPTNHHHSSLDPEKLDETPPFDQPGLRQIGENEYELVVIGYAFGFQPSNVEIPKGATVHFIATSRDVVHGFQINGTIINMMLIPGEVNETTYTFDKPGEYLVLCNEYCGIGHEYMATRLIVK
jgi:cytochrome c oxidase subunit 2